MSLKGRLAKLEEQSEPAQERPKYYRLFEVVLTPMGIGYCELSATHVPGSVFGNDEYLSRRVAELRAENVYVALVWDPERWSRPLSWMDYPQKDTEPLTPERRAENERVDELRRARVNEQTVFKFDTSVDWKRLYDEWRANNG